jgi:hypothetical protein
VKIIDPLTIHILTDGPAPTMPNDFVRLFIVSHKAAGGLTRETANEAFNTARRRRHRAVQVRIMDPEERTRARALPWLLARAGWPGIA